MQSMPLAPESMRYMAEAFETCPQKQRFKLRWSLAQK